SLFYDESSIIGKYDKRAAPPTKGTETVKNLAELTLQIRTLRSGPLRQRERTRPRRNRLLNRQRYPGIVEVADDLYGNRWKLRSISMQLGISRSSGRSTIVPPVCSRFASIFLHAFWGRRRIERNSDDSLSSDFGIKVYA
ncbi:hypothetical protein WH47_02966, partial [Habropoda laboriosa]